MRQFLSIFSITILLTLPGCITEFYPGIEEAQSLLVVQGLITDQPEANVIKLSKSHSLELRETSEPLTGCRVIIDDDQNNNYELEETEAGKYVTDPAEFRAVTGRKYTLRIYKMDAGALVRSYESIAMEMKPVPPIDTLWYEKVVISENEFYKTPNEGCRVYLNTVDPDGLCRYFRWDFTETWEFRLPFDVDNYRCWITNKSSPINIKNTSVLSGNIIMKQPVNFITNETDRLIYKYSMLVRQYSLTEDEFSYWEKLQNVTQEIGSLYDIIPASVIGNVRCLENPDEKVLGYFSVSALKSKRIFIDEDFKGQPYYYGGCITGEVPPVPPPPGLNETFWEITYDRYTPSFPMKITTNKGCVDCTTRGSLIKPDFWDED